MDEKLRPSHLYNRKMYIPKSQDKYKNSLSQMLSMLISRLKAVKNIMRFSLLFIS